MSTAVTGLVAETNELEDSAAPGHTLEPEVVAGEDGLLWRDPDLAMAGLGVALRIDLPQGLDSVGAVAQALAGVEIRGGAHSAGESSPGTRGPVALGALPFDRSSPGHLVVPSVLV
ncbi:MAG: hypothetical protein ACRDYC_02190, partial [Acidimicrobiales bacterium]